MDSQTAHTIWIAAVTGGGLLWLGAGWLARSFWDDRPLCGQVSLPLHPLAAAPEVARELASAEGLQLRVLSADSQRIEAQLSPPTLYRMRGAHPRSGPPARLRVQLYPEGAGTLLQYAVDGYALGRPCRVLALALLGLGLLALLGAVFLGSWLASSPDEAARVQVWQTLQVVHFLWPPYLLTWLCRRLRTTVAGELEDFFQNLPYRLAPSPRR